MWPSELGVWRSGLLASSYPGDPAELEEQNLDHPGEPHQAEGENEEQVEEALCFGRARALARHVALLRRRRLEHGLDGIERRQLGGSFEGLRERPLDVVVDPVDELALASGFYRYRRLRSRFGERTIRAARTTSSPR